MIDKENKFLVYKIGDLFYGSPLLSIREVLEYQPPKPMPNMVPHFSGVVNVRGLIVGIIDLRVKFRCPTEVGRKAAMLLCDTTEGPLAAIVDSVESVQQFENDQFEKDVAVQSNIERDYLLGIAKDKNHLITIIDLHKSMENSNLKAA